MNLVDHIPRCLLKWKVGYIYFFFVYRKEIIEKSNRSTSWPKKFEDIQAVTKHYQSKNVCEQNSYFYDLRKIYVDSNIKYIQESMLCFNILYYLSVKLLYNILII